MAEPLSVTLLGAKPLAGGGFGSGFVENERITGGVDGGALVETVVSPIEPGSGAVTSDRGGGGFPLPVEEKTEALEAKPVPITVPDIAIFFRRLELTVPPALKDEPLIDVPDEREVRGIRGGKLTLRLFVRSSGDVERVEIDNSSSPAAYEEAAVAAFLPLRFWPGEIDGVAVSSQVVFEVDFDTEAKGTSRSTDRANWWGSSGMFEKPALDVRSSSHTAQEGEAKTLKSERK